MILDRTLWEFFLLFFINLPCVLGLAALSLQTELTPFLHQSGSTNEHFFLYDFASEIWPQCSSAGHKNEARELGVQLIGLPPEHYATGQFSLATILRCRLLSHPQRTTNPQQASVLVLPVPDPGANGLAETTMQNLMADKIFLMYRNSKRHLMIWPRIGQDLSGVRIPISRNLVVVSIEQDFGPVLNNQQHTRYNIISIPYPTAFHPASLSSLQMHQNAVLKNTRVMLTSFCGSSGGESSQDREIVLTECKKHKEACEFRQISRRALASASTQECYESYRKSVFCLHPSGDSLTRKSFFDGIVNGCIPVLFDKRWQLEYSLHLPRDWRTFSIFANPSGFLQQLASLPASRVTSLQAAVVKLIPRVVYSRTTWDSSFEDAATLLLHAALQDRL